MAAPGRQPLAYIPVPLLLRPQIRPDRQPADDAANPTYIFTQRGVGYRMAKPGDP